MGASSSALVGRAAVMTSLAVTSQPYSNSTTVTSTTAPLNTTAYPIVPGKTFTACYTTNITATTTISGIAQVTTEALTSYSLAPTPSTSAYTFNPDARDNLAVYYGQSPNTVATGLLTICEQADVDIVILAFVNSFFGPQGYPVVNFGPACDPPTTEQQEQAPGLLDCPNLATQISGCQSLGKKVLVSLGGYIANTTLPSSTEAVQLAETLWNLFGGGRQSLDIRPFGPDVVLDGFDIDNENHNTTFYNTFATALRQQLDQDTSKDYYISAAPQCPIPDESIPLGAMLAADFVWVQHYNNPSCNLNATGFAASFAAWSKQLTNNGTSNSTAAPGRPRVYVGAGAFQGAGPGYVDGDEFGGYIAMAKNATNFGGVMLWDGSEGLANVDAGGVSYLDYAKAAVQ